MNVNFYSYGGVGEVTGSKHILEIDGHKILIDCGMFQGKRSESDIKNRNLPFKGSEIEVCVNTHGHLDHCGNYPTIIKSGFSGNIFSTSATRDIASIILFDSANIQAKDMEFINKISQKKGKSIDAVKPLYDVHNVEETLSHYVTIGYHRSINVCDGATLTFYDAGHILGSALAVFDIKDKSSSLRVAFTGDLGRNNLPIIKDPEFIGDVDYLICESTYGNRLHDNYDKTKSELTEVITSTYQKGGKIIIPAFAVERTQEIVYLLHLLKDEKKIPTDLDIYIDSPMALNATTVFQLHPECYDEETKNLFTAHRKNPFGFEHVTYIQSAEESKRLNDLRKPAIIISSSGMCENGRILHHLKNNIEKANNTVLIIGYMAENTLGRKIADRIPRVNIFGETYNLNARVKILNSFSGHADYNEILAYVSHINNKRLKNIYLVHGEKEASDNLKSLLNQNNYQTDVAVFNHKYQLN